MADNNPVTFDEEGYPDLTQLSEEGFVDMVFAVRDVHVDKNGWHTIRADAKHQGTVVGLNVIVRPGMGPGVVDGQVDISEFHPDGVWLGRSGPESDRLLGILASLYGIDVIPKTFREYVRSTSVALFGDPGNLGQEYVKFKVFHDDKDEHGEYFELYVHVNLPGGVVAVNEKDHEYRPTVIKGCSEVDL